MAASQGSGQVSRAVQARFGLSDTFRTSGPFPFSGMNTQASRLAIGDPELYYCENYIKIGDGNLRTVPDSAEPLYTNDDARTQINFNWFNIGTTNYCAVFFDDGSAVQVDLQGNVTVMSAAASGLFYQSDGSYPASVQWGNLYLLIGNNNTANDYWAWDGSVLYGAGTVSPIIDLTASGQNYIGTPNYTIWGGTGSGVVVTPVIANGSVVSLKVDDPGTGYVPGDVVQVIFSGGGSDTGARLRAGLIGTAVNEIIVLAGGTGYATAPTVVISGAHTTLATATATVSGGRVTLITITNPGAGYEAAPIITFTGGGGTGAQAQATLVATGVNAIDVQDGGTNYFGVPTLTIKGGIGSGATAVAVMSGPGPIAGITITAAGTGYTGIPTVTIADSGGGTGSGATAIVNGITGGTVTSVLLTDPGQGYSAPTVAFSGGGGSGATADAILGGGSIASVTVTNPGFGYINAPAVIVEPGTNSAAQALLELMPFGISGDSIETYNSQVWIQNPYPAEMANPPAGTQPTGGVRNSSAPGSISDFATSDGGLQETSTDRFLKRQLTQIRQSNGFLYPFGDSSVGVISNVQIQGSPPTKTLTNQNTDPQTGTHWRDTVQDFGRTVLFANPFGVYGLFGGAVTKISAKMDGVFNNANFPTTENPGGSPITPTAAVANLYNRKVYLLLMNITDPLTKSAKNAMLAWNEQDWSLVTQTRMPVYIGTQEIDSQLTAWGTDGKSLYSLMTAPSTNLTKTLASKLYGTDRFYIQKAARAFFVQAENFADQNAAPLFNLTIDTEYASFTAPSPTLAFPLPNQTMPSNASRPPVQCPLLEASTGDVAGYNIGFQLSSTGADHSIYNMAIATEDVGAVTV